MLMRIQMRWLLAGQFAKCGELAVNFVSHGAGVVGGDHGVTLNPLAVFKNPFAQVEVQAEAEARVMLRIGSGFSGGGWAHHQAGAGHDASFGAFNDATVHTVAKAEIIGVDNQVTRHSQSPARCIRLPKTFSAAKNSAAISRAARQWPG